MKKTISLILSFAMASQLWAQNSQAEKVSAEQKLAAIDQLVNALDEHGAKIQNLEKHPNALAELKKTFLEESAKTQLDPELFELLSIQKDIEKKVMLDPKDAVRETRVNAIKIAVAGFLVELALKKKYAGYESIKLVAAALGVGAAGAYLSLSDTSSPKLVSQKILGEIERRKKDLKALRDAIVAESTAQKKAQKRLRAMSSEGESNADGPQVLPVHIE